MLESATLVINMTSLMEEGRSYIPDGLKNIVSGHSFIINISVIG